MYMCMSDRHADVMLIASYHICSNTYLIISEDDGSEEPVYTEVERPTLSIDEVLLLQDPSLDDPSTTSSSSSSSGKAGTACVSISQPSCLLVEMRGYQLEALQWMTSRESVSGFGSAVTPSETGAKAAPTVNIRG